MSRLYELIQGLCPDGVEYKKIDNLFNIFNGMTGVSLKWKEEGNCRFIDYMNVYNNLKIDVTRTPYATVKSLNQNNLRQGDILVTTASEVPDECAITAVIESEIEDKIFLDDHLFGLRLKEEYSELISTTYANYCMSASEFRSAVRKKVKGVTRFFVSPNDIGQIRLPIPPLGVQREIVRILDNFTELTAELTARKQQYGYYRSQLLDRFRNHADVVPISDLGKWSGGKTPSMANKKYWENGTIPWISSKDMKAPILQNTEDHITEIALDEAGMTLLPENVVAIVTRSGILKHTFPMAYVEGENIDASWYTLDLSSMESNRINLDSTYDIYNDGDDIICCDLSNIYHYDPGSDELENLFTYDCDSIFPLVYTGGYLYCREAHVFSDDKQYGLWKYDIVTGETEKIEVASGYDIGSVYFASPDWILFTAYDVEESGFSESVKLVSTDGEYNEIIDTYEYN